MTIAELSTKALNYIKNISFGNHNSTYTPSGYLKPDDSVLASYDKTVYWDGGGYQESGKFYQKIYTNETIPTKYTTSVDDNTIASHWSSFKSTYIDTLFIDQLAPISLSSFLIFIYLFRCFMDTRFKLFTDSYHKDYVWLYNSDSVTYNVDTSYKPLTYTTSTLSLTTVQTYITKVLNEITTKGGSYILDSKTVATF